VGVGLDQARHQGGTLAVDDPIAVLAYDTLLRSADRDDAIVFHSHRAGLRMEAGAIENADILKNYSAHVVVPLSL
jgi:hypothetical protein